MAREVETYLNFLVFGQFVQDVQPIKIEIDKNALQ